MTQETITAADVGAVNAADLGLGAAATREITEWIRRLNAWAADETEKENVRHVIARAEDAWNKTNDNTPTVVEKHLSADDLKGQAVGNWAASVDAFLVAQEA